MGWYEATVSLDFDGRLRTHRRGGPHEFLHGRSVGH